MSKKKAATDNADNLDNLDTDTAVAADIDDAETAATAPRYLHFCPQCRRDLNLGENNTQTPEPCDRCGNPGAITMQYLATDELDAALASST